MQRIENVIYDAKPDDITVYPSCVDVVKSCTEVEIEDEMSGETSTKYQCDVERYTTSEYIDVIQKKNGELEQQMTQTQVGIVEAYEMLLGLM